MKSDMKINRFKQIHVIGFSACCLMFSCWYYSFTGRGLPGIETISIPLFADRTTEIQVRDKLQNMLISFFQDENILKVVGENQADAVLSGVLEVIEDVPTAINRQEEAQQFELRISVQIKFENRKTGKIIVNERLTGIGFYKDPLAERQEAITQALTQLTRDISNKLLSGW